MQAQLKQPPIGENTVTKAQVTTQQAMMPLRGITKKALEAEYAKGTRLFHRLDLGGMNLNGAMLDGATFDSCNMSGVNLTGACLTCATIKSEDLLSMVNTDFKNARLENATLMNLDLSKAKNFESADLLWTKYGGMVNVMVASQFAAVCAHIEKGVRKYAAGKAIKTETEKCIGDVNRNILIVNPIVILERK